MSDFDGEKKLDTGRGLNNFNDYLLDMSYGATVGASAASKATFKNKTYKTIHHLYLFLFHFTYLFITLTIYP